jgi:ATP-dependent DNA helicase RecG
MRSDGAITPFPSITVEKRTLAACEVAVVIVQPADAPPVRYGGRVWVRIGPSTTVATAEEERRLAEKRRSKDLHFELSLVRTASIVDLDLDLFSRAYLPSAVSPDVLEQNQRSMNQQLVSTRFVGVGSDAPPTVLGTLVIGKEPRDWVPGAYVQFLRIDGTELTDPIVDQKEISGPLPEMLRYLDEVLQAHVSVATDVRSRPVEVRAPDYPMVALQQIGRNAVLHRIYEGTNAPVLITWFNDRIEVLNPGGPYGQVTRANFGQPGVTD